MSVQVGDPKSTLFLRNTHQLPRGLAIRAGSRSFTSPEERTTFGVNRINDTFGKHDGAHGIDGEAREYQTNKDLTATLVEKGASPASEVFVESIKQGLEIGWPYLGSGEREA